MKYIKPEFQEKSVGDIKVIKPRHKNTIVSILFTQKEIFQERRGEESIETTLCGINFLKERILVNEELDKLLRSA